MVSHLRAEQKTCIVCLASYKTGAMLLSDVPSNETEWGLCPPHQRLRDRNLIALVEIDPQNSSTPDFGETTTPDKVKRTGTVVYISRSIYDQVFTGEPPDYGVAFVPPEVVATLQRLRALRGGEHPH